MVKAEVKVLEDPGKMYRLEHHVKDAVRSQQIKDIKIRANKQNRITMIEGEISQEQLDAILSTSTIKYDDINYRELKEEEKKSLKVTYPEDYWLV